jgi:hypothetical protein
MLSQTTCIHFAQADKLLTATCCEWRSTRHQSKTRYNMHSWIAAR